MTFEAASDHVEYLRSLGKIPDRVAGSARHALSLLPTIRLDCKTNPASVRGIEVDKVHGGHRRLLITLQCDDASCRCRTYPSRYCFPF